MSSDILDRLAAYAPTPTSVADEWGPTERGETLAAVFDDLAGTGRPLRFRPRALPARAVAPIAASVVVLALAGTVALVADRDDGGSTDPAGTGVPGSGPSSGSTTPQVFRATVATPRLRADQWAYRATTADDPSHGSTSATQRYAVWVAADGSGQQQSVDGAATCLRLRPVRPAELDDPTQAFVDTLPTDPGALRTYFDKHVQGSTSHEEAIFTAVGDLLREGDLLASSTQRAAMVTVLAGLRRTAVHTDVDARGRAAVRVDFLDPNQRGSDIQSLYFDPHTFQLLEERSSQRSFTPDAGPSAPYSSTPSAQATSEQQLPAKASVVVMTDEKIVDALPTNCGR